MNTEELLNKTRIVGDFFKFEMGTNGRGRLRHGMELWKKL
jgi:hypothetical protein